MKQIFSSIRLNKANVERLEIVESIIDEYYSEGYKLTLRQLYYQLVSRDIIANSDREYKKLGTLLVKGRMNGVIDWSAIEDRVRTPYIPYWVRGKSEAIQDCVDQYRLDRQKGQNNYLELWVEKDALSGVLRRRTAHYQIYLMVNRGYSSATAMYEASRRFINREESGQSTFILYLGDHDPSGLDMVRDVQDRMNIFGSSVEVRHIGLTLEQIEELKPPPNPAKITDTRASEYINKYGATSWEVDAIPPKRLHEIVDENILDLVDLSLYDARVAKENNDIDDLQEIADKFESER